MMNAAKTAPGTDGQSPALTAALSYRERGCSVIPLHATPRGPKVDEALRAKAAGEDLTEEQDLLLSLAKKPLVGWTRYQKERASEETIRGWWGRWPDANVAIVTGAISGLVAVDADGEEGAEALRELEAKNDALPHTPESLTGGGGRHLLFAHPGGMIDNKVRIAPGLDIRADGGYIVAPPSLHVSGRTYAWELSAHPDDVPPAPPPLWLLTTIAAAKTAAPSPKGQPAWVTKALRGVGKGKRNATGTRLAGHYLRRKLSITETVTQLLDWNTRNRPPLGEKELRQVVASVDKKEQAKAAASAGEPAAAHHLTDVGNAELLAELSGDQMRFVHLRPKAAPVAGWWRVWDGRRWADDEGGAAARFAHEMARERLRQAADIPDTKAAEAAVKWALSSDSTRKIRDTLEAASWQRALLSRPTDYDTDPYLLNVANGLLDLRTGDLHPHYRAAMCHRLSPVAFDSKARAPRWERFLAEVFDGNDALIDFIRRAVGYSLTGAATEDCLLLLHGSGTNGKSRLLAVLGALLGDYALATDFATFTLQREKQAAIRNDIARLAGARLVTASETSDGLRFSEGVLKQLTGGDRVAARFLNQEFFEFTIQAKFWLSCNHRPRVHDSSEAFWRRIRLVPFTVSFRGREDKHLLPALLSELPGILTWAVAGCLEWQAADDLLAPPEVVAATSSYQVDEDTVGRFLADCCEISPDAESTTAALYAAYRSWSEGNAERPMGARTFGREIGARGYQPVRIGARQARGWRGLDLCADQDVKTW